MTIDGEKAETPAKGRDFIRTVVDRDVAEGKRDGKVITRFPPEPNGYLHIGHAKAICLNFGLAEEYGGQCHLRFDDTNPAKEEADYVEGIKADIRWLGFDWGEYLCHASDYFEKLYGFAEELVEKGNAYVCSLSQEEIRKYRGTLTEPGRESPDRDRSAEENLDLFRRMRAGEFEAGSYVLRAKIDMASPNITMRDPVIYRILNASHYRTGDTWCIYPMYDFTHCLSDSIERITHSLCTLEFEDRRPLYDWVLDNVGAPCHPQQIEFARLNLGHTVMSKRKLLKLVEDGRVSGWDDPRMPTLAGMRRRGFPPEAIRVFCDRIGLAKRDSLVDIAMLEHAVREVLNRSAPRFMGVLDPLRLVIENYPADRVEEMEAVNNPEDPAAGSRSVSFGRELFIERDDFRPDPPRKFYRLSPGREVRLRYGYLVTCTDFATDPKTGEVTEVRVRYDPETRGGSAPDGRRVKSTMHWVHADSAIRLEVRLYEHLFRDPVPDLSAELDDLLHPTSLTRKSDCYGEPALCTLEPGSRLQLERVGYFCLDPDSRPGKPVLNRTVSLRDSWARIQKKQKKEQAC